MGLVCGKCTCMCVALDCDWLFSFKMSNVLMSFQEKESLYCACQKTYMAALQQSELRMCQNTLALQALGHDERQKHCRYYIAAKHLM